jgi:hypothetical protein
MRFADSGAAGDLDLFKAKTADPWANIELWRRAARAAAGA